MDTLLPLNVQLCTNLPEKLKAAKLTLEKEENKENRVLVSCNKLTNISEHRSHMASFIDPLKNWWASGAFRQIVPWQTIAEAYTRIRIECHVSQWIQLHFKFISVLRKKISISITAKSKVHVQINNIARQSNIKFEHINLFIPSKIKVPTHSQ